MVGCIGHSKTASTVSRTAFEDRSSSCVFVATCDTRSLIATWRAEHGLSVDHVTIWRWVQRYAPVLNQRIRREMRRPNRSWPVDETYIKVAGDWTYLYRAVDSTGETIEFMLSPKRDLIAAKLFLRLMVVRRRGPALGH